MPGSAISRSDQVTRVAGLLEYHAAKPGTVKLGSGYPKTNLTQFGTGEVGSLVWADIAISCDSHSDARDPVLPLLPVNGSSRVQVHSGRQSDLAPARPCGLWVHREVELIQSIVSSEDAPHSIRIVRFFRVGVRKKQTS